MKTVLLWIFDVTSSPFTHSLIPTNDEASFIHLTSVLLVSKMFMTKGLHMVSWIHVPTTYCMSMLKKLPNFIKTSKIVIQCWREMLLVLVPWSEPSSLTCGCWSQSKENIWNCGDTTKAMTHSMQCDSAPRKVICMEDRRRKVGWILMLTELNHLHPWSDWVRTRREIYPSVFQLGHICSFQ